MRQLRYDLGWTQAELAERAGVKVSTVKKYEGPRVKRPHPHSLKAVADALGVAPSDLFIAD